MSLSDDFQSFKENSELLKEVVEGSDTDTATTPGGRVLKSVAKSIKDAVETGLAGIGITPADAEMAVVAKSTTAALSGINLADYSAGTVFQDTDLGALATVVDEGGTKKLRYESLVFGSVGLMEAHSNTHSFNGQTCFAKGLRGGRFILDTSGALGAGAENGVTVFAAAGGTNWYWVRVVETANTIRSEWAGVVGDGITNDTAAVKRIRDYCRITKRFAKPITVLWQAGYIATDPIWWQSRSGITHKGVGAWSRNWSANTVMMPRAAQTHVWRFDNDTDETGTNLLGDGFMAGLRIENISIWGSVASASLVDETQSEETITGRLSRVALSESMLYLHKVIDAEFDRLQFTRADASAVKTYQCYEHVWRSPRFEFMGVLDKPLVHFYDTGNNHSAMTWDDVVVEAVTASCLIEYGANANASDFTFNNFHFELGNEAAATGMISDLAGGIDDVTVLPLVKFSGVAVGHIFNNVLLTNLGKFYIESGGVKYAYARMFEAGSGYGQVSFLARNISLQSAGWWSWAKIGSGTAASGLIDGVLYGFPDDDWQGRPTIENDGNGRIEIRAEIYHPVALSAAGESLLTLDILQQPMDRTWYATHVGTYNAGWNFLRADENSLSREKQVLIHDDVSSQSTLFQLPWSCIEPYFENGDIIFKFRARRWDAAVATNKVGVVVYYDDTTNVFVESDALTDDFAWYSVRVRQNTLLPSGKSVSALRISCLTGEVALDAFLIQQARPFVALDAILAKNYTLADTESVTISTPVGIANGPAAFVFVPTVSAAGIMLWKYGTALSYAGSLPFNLDVGTSGTNPDTAGKLNIWCPGANTIAVKNNMGADRSFTLHALAGPVHS